VLRVRQKNDPGPEKSRSGADRNVIAIDKPLIGKETSTLLPAALAAELGDPKVLGGPIAFTIRKGQRIKATGLDVKLDGEIPVGLQTGDIEIELLTDGGGDLSQPHQATDQRPENERSPLYVDLSMDFAVYAKDAKGNAVLTQTVLGVQAAGTAVGSDGVLAIETMTSMELGLLGVTSAPSNLVLELITDPAAHPDTDVDPPAIVRVDCRTRRQRTAGRPGRRGDLHEPIDLERARAGGIRLETKPEPSSERDREPRRLPVVVRPTANLAYTTTYRVVPLRCRRRRRTNFPRRIRSRSRRPGWSTPTHRCRVAAVHPGVFAGRRERSEPGPCQVVASAMTCTGLRAAREREHRCGVSTHRRPDDHPSTARVQHRLASASKKSMGGHLPRGPVAGHCYHAHRNAVVSCPTPRGSSTSAIACAWSPATTPRATRASYAPCRRRASFDPLAEPRTARPWPDLAINFVERRRPRRPSCSPMPTVLRRQRQRQARQRRAPGRRPIAPRARDHRTTGAGQPGDFTSPDCVPSMPAYPAGSTFTGTKPRGDRQVQSSAPAHLHRRRAASVTSHAAMYAGHRGHAIGRT